MKKRYVIQAAIVTIVAVAASVLTIAQSQLEITSFASNGKLSWKDTGGTGTNRAVQWSPDGTTHWYSWKDADANLTGLGPEGTVEVPMFYRVVSPDPDYQATEHYTYFEKLPPFDPLTPLDTNEMRITFMGSMIPLPVRRAQAEMSIFVEVGWQDDPSDTYYHGRPVDQFIFDMGAGVSANYAAAKVGYRLMDKVFINHLHADHMTDLIHTYCFGPSADRKSPLYVWGSGPTGIESPANSNIFYDDGVKAFCSYLREALRWHTESFSFQGTAYEDYEPPTQASWGLPHEPLSVSDDAANDAYALVPIELDWRQIGGVAYSNALTSATITHFPVIHCRKGAMGYKLSWKTPGGDELNMVYTSDTKPETNCVEQAKNAGKGVDVFIHEMVVPPDVWAYKSMGLNAPPSEGDPSYSEFQNTVKALMEIQNSSHTTQGAFGYILKQIDPKPKLTIATHFPTADDTVASALQSVKAHCPEVEMGRDIVWSFDLMVIRVFPDRIEQCRAVVSDYSFYPPARLSGKTLPPKYNDGKGGGDPYYQIDLSSEIPATNELGEVNYRIDGY